MPHHTASSPALIARRLHVHGTVQGVYFRQSTVDAARRLGLAGWVRNRRDGSVETLAVGTPEQVQALIDWAHQGPAAARVERVQVLEEALPEPLPGGFTQEATV